MLAAGAHAFLGRGRARVVARLPAEEDVLELVHAGVGEQQRRVPGRDQRRRRHHAVTALGKELEKALADLTARPSSSGIATRLLRRARARGCIAAAPKPRASRYRTTFRRRRKSPRSPGTSRGRARARSAAEQLPPPRSRGERRRGHLALDPAAAERRPPAARRPCRGKLPSRYTTRPAPRRRAIRAPASRPAPLRSRPVVEPLAAADRSASSGRDRARRASTREGRTWSFGSDGRSRNAAGVRRSPRSTCTNLDCRVLLAELERAALGNGSCPTIPAFLPSPRATGRRSTGCPGCGGAARRGWWRGGAPRRA